MDDNIDLDILNYKNGYIDGMAHMLGKFCGNKKILARCCSIYELDDVILNEFNIKNFKEISINKTISELLIDFLCVDISKGLDEDALKQIQNFEKILISEYGKLKTVSLLETHNAMSTIIVGKFSEFALALMVC